MVLFAVNIRLTIIVNITRFSTADGAPQRYYGWVIRIIDTLSDICTSVILIEIFMAKPQPELLVQSIYCHWLE